MFVWLRSCRCIKPLGSLGSMNTQKLKKIKKLSFENLEMLEKMETLLDLMCLDADGKKPYAVRINILKRASALLG